MMCSGETEFVCVCVWGGAVWYKNAIEFNENLIISHISSTLSLGLPLC